MHGFADKGPMPHTRVDLSSVYAGQLAGAERGAALLKDDYGRRLRQADGEGFPLSRIKQGSDLVQNLAHGGVREGTEQRCLARPPVHAFDLV